MSTALLNSTAICTFCGITVPVERLHRAPRGSGYQVHDWCSDCHVPRRKAQLAERNRRFQMAKYDLTVEEFDAMLQEQGYKCAICRREQCPSYGILSVDHDHSTGSVRGLLCASCNKGLGFYLDDPLLLEAAAQYLRARDFR